MPREQEEFQRAVASVLEAVMFENWLRFYFIAERAEADENGDAILFLDIPDRAMERIGRDYAHLLPMAEALRGKDASFENSRQAVCSFVAAHLEGSAVPARMAGRVLDSGTFQIRNELFNTWVQTHEEALGADVLGFDQWRSLFARWCETDKVKELALKLASASMGGATVH